MVLVIKEMDIIIETYKLNLESLNFRYQGTEQVSLSKKQ